MVYHVRKNFNKDKEPSTPAPIVREQVKQAPVVPRAETIEHVQIEPPRKLGNVRFEAPQMMRADIQELEKTTTLNLTNTLMIIVILILASLCIWLYLKNRKSGSPPPFYYF